MPLRVGIATPLIGVSGAGWERKSIASTRYMTKKVIIMLSAGKPVNDCKTGEEARVVVSFHCL